MKSKAGHNKAFLAGYRDGVEESKINRARILVTRGMTDENQVSPDDGLDYWSGYAIGRIDWYHNTVDYLRIKEGAYHEHTE